MRLFLSSQDLGNYAERAFELAGENKKAAFMKNAQDDLPSDERNSSNPQKQKMFEDAGFEFEMIDLRDYFGKPAELLNKLSDFGSIWSSGGNTFILRRAFKASGFDEIIIKMLKEDKILYGGWSAGACITGRSLHGIEYGDRPQPEVVPDSYPIKDTIWDGLGLIPYMIVPHCDSDWFIKDAHATIKYFETYNRPYKKLKDGQVIIVNGGKEEFLK
jgi:dipeptidase E